MSKIDHKSKKWRMARLFCGEHMLEYVLAVALMILIGALVSSPYGRAVLAGDLYGFKMILLVATVSLLVRAVTQIPLCAYLRIRRARRHGFSLAGALVIIAVWFAILQFVFQGVAPFVLWEMKPGGPWENTVAFFTRLFRPNMIRIYFAAGLPLHLAALLAPVLMHKLFGETYDSLVTPTDSANGGPAVENQGRE